MSTADVLDRAADLIARDGLCQGAWWSETVVRWTPGTPCCVAGAIAVASGDTTIRDAFACWVAAHPAFLAFAAHLGYTDQPGLVIKWSDDPIRTPERVVRELRDCAAKLRTPVPA